MEHRFRDNTADEEMPDRGAQYLVENAGIGAEGPSSGREWMAHQQQQQAAD